MEKVFSKYKRGDVWYIKFENENGDGVNGSSVQKKSRPHLIISCEENNNHAPVFQVIPIATMNYDHLPNHVYFRNGERDQIVMCEQIKTISILDFTREGSHFMYSFNIEFMNKVEEALARQLGLRTRVADMKVLENLIDKIAEKKENELKDKYENTLKMRVEEIAEDLSRRFGIDLTSKDMLNGKTYSDSDLKYVPKDIVDEFKETAKDRTSPALSNVISENTENTSSLLLNKSKTVSKSTSTIESDNSICKSGDVIKKRNKWTEENMRKFLDDKKKMTLKDIADKYNVKKSSVYQLEYTFKNKLGINDNKK